MARIPDAFIDDLLARTDIVEVIGARVPLKRQGKEYSARCPFHDERSPSFTVSQTKQFYHCFGCGAHGTAISFLMNYDRLEFLDAVERAGQARRAWKCRATPSSASQSRQAARRCTGALEAAACVLRAAAGQAASKARAYLDRRGVDAGDRRALRHRLRARWLRRARATRSARDARPHEAAGARPACSRKSDNGQRLRQVPRPRDVPDPRPPRPRDRVRRPRARSRSDSPKYLNSPETALFHKGRELYGLWQVTPGERRSSSG